MSSNGVMLQDYVPNAINNLTEDIWCAGAVIPAGKRVVLGHIRDGWQEITFTMGKMQDFIGMALVPPEVVGIEPTPLRGFGMKPMGVAAMMMRSRRQPDFRSPTIDQNAPLPPQPFEMPASPQQGQYTAADTARRARMEQALPPNQGKAPRRGVPPYQWGGLSGMMPSVMRGRLHGMGSPGLGASGASAFTMKAAQALNDHLVTNNCAGCSDMTSLLRQLTFAFKAAVMTDTGISPQMNLNMSNALAMTAYGSGTDQALKNILGAAGTYANGPCTDDNGNCLGNLPTPAVPPSAAALEQQFVHAIQIAMQQAQYVPQPELVKGLVQGFAALINQIGVELVKLQVPVESKPPPPPPTTTAPSTGVPWSTIAIGGLIGTTILATGALVYTHARRG